jgi:hypothetical protein
MLQLSTPDQVPWRSFVSLFQLSYPSLLHFWHHLANTPCPQADGIDDTANASDVGSTLQRMGRGGLDVGAMGEYVRIVEGTKTVRKLMVFSPAEYSRAIARPFSALGHTALMAQRAPAELAAAAQRKSASDALAAAMAAKDDAGVTAARAALAAVVEPPPVPDAEMGAALLLVRALL